MLKKLDDVLTELKAAVVNITPKSQKKYLHKKLVGLDYLGDENQYPLCPFNTPEFLEFLKNHPKMGFRFHCGENIPGSEEAQLIHLAIASKVILDIISEMEKLEPKRESCYLRIGHGIGFSNTVHDSPTTHDYFVKFATAQAILKSHQIPLEVCPTSNNYLLYSNHNRKALMYKSNSFV